MLHVDQFEAPLGGQPLHPVLRVTHANTPGSSGSCLFRSGLAFSLPRATSGRRNSVIH